MEEIVNEKLKNVEEPSAIPKQIGVFFGFTIVFTGIGLIAEDWLVGTFIGLYLGFIFSQLVDM